MLKKYTQIFCLCFMITLSVPFFANWLQNTPAPHHHRKCNVTLVTAYFAFPSKHTESEYHRWMTSGVLSLDACLVVFAAEESRQLLESTSHRIRYTSLHHEAWRLNHSLSFWVRQFEMDPEAWRHQGPQVYWVWALKSVFVRDVVLENPFNTEYFFWIDIGYIRDGGYRGRSLRAAVPTLPSHKVLFLLIRPFGDCCGGLSDDHLAGNMWGGTAGAVLRFREAFFQTFERLADAGQFVGKDQTIMNHVCSEEEGLCSILDPKKMDRWFFMLPYLLGDDDAWNSWLG